MESRRRPNHSVSFALDIDNEDDEYNAAFDQILGPILGSDDRTNPPQPRPPRRSGSAATTVPLSSSSSDSSDSTPAKSTTTPRSPAKRPKQPGFNRTFRRPETDPRAPLPRYRTDSPNPPKPLQLAAVVGRANESQLIVHRGASEQRPPKDQERYMPASPLLPEFVVLQLPDLSGLKRRVGELRLYHVVGLFALFAFLVTRAFLVPSCAACHCAEDNSTGNATSSGMDVKHTPVENMSSARTAFDDGPESELSTDSTSKSADSMLSTPAPSQPTEAVPLPQPLPPAPQAVDSTTAVSPPSQDLGQQPQVAARVQGMADGQAFPPTQPGVDSTTAVSAQTQAVSPQPQAAAPVQGTMSGPAFPPTQQAFQGQPMTSIQMQVPQPSTSQFGQPVQTVYAPGTNFVAAIPQQAFQMVAQIPTVAPTPPSGASVAQTASAESETPSSTSRVSEAAVQEAAAAILQHLQQQASTEPKRSQSAPLGDPASFSEEQGSETDVGTAQRSSSTGDQIPTTGSVRPPYQAQGTNAVQQTRPGASQGDFSAESYAAAQAEDQDALSTGSEQEAYAQVPPAALQGGARVGGPFTTPGSRPEAQNYLNNQPPSMPGYAQQQPPAAAYPPSYPF